MSKEYDQSIINLLRWHYKFSLKESITLLDCHNELNEHTKEYMPITNIVRVLKRFETEYND